MSEVPLNLHSAGGWAGGASTSAGRAGGGGGAPAPRLKHGPARSYVRASPMRTFPRQGYRGTSLKRNRNPLRTNIGRALGVVLL